MKDKIKNDVILAMDNELSRLHHNLKSLHIPDGHIKNKLMEEIDKINDFLITLAKKENGMEW